MAGLTTRLKGAILIEALVSLVIIGFTFTMGVIIFVSVIRGNDFERRIRAAYLLETCARRLRAGEANASAANLSTGGLVVEQTKTPYEGAVLLQLTAKAEGDTAVLAVYREILNHEEETE